MPLEQQTPPRDADGPAPAPAPTPALFAWEADPVVVVSRRPRALYYPADLLRGDATPAQVKAWTDPKGGEYERKFLALQAGVNFIGVLTSSWLYKNFDGRSAPQAAPPPDKCILLYPDTNGRDVLTSPRTGTTDRETGRLIPAKIRAIFERILRFHKAHLSTGDDNLWDAPDGFDAPELMLMPLSEIFAQRGAEAAGAHVTVVQSIKFLRASAGVETLGALHDYAIRHRSGNAIAGECKAWLTRKKLG